jgi:hypothetical protein
MTHFYFTVLYILTSHTQTVITTGSGCRTCCTSWIFFVHAGTYNISARSIVTHVILVVPAVSTIIRCEPTANLTRIGPRYLAVVTGVGTEPGGRNHCD